MVMDGHKAARVRVRALQSHQRPFEAVGPGHRLAVNLSGTYATNLNRPQATISLGRITATYGS